MNLSGKLTTWIFLIFYCLIIAVLVVHTSDGRLATVSTATKHSVEAVLRRMSPRHTGYTTESQATESNVVISRFKRQVLFAHAKANVTDEMPSVAMLIDRDGLMSAPPVATRRWTVVAASPFFGRPHVSARGDIDCPGGCKISWRHRVGAASADFMFVHDNSRNLRLKQYHAQQLLGLWAHETFDLLDRPIDHYSHYHCEMTYRTTSVYRASYMGTVVPYMRISIDESGPDARLRRIRCWADIFPASVAPRERVPMTAGSISFASSHCNSKSGREDVVRSIMARVKVVAVGSSCLKNAPLSLLNMSVNVRIVCSGDGATRCAQTLTMCQLPTQLHSLSPNGPTGSTDALQSL